MDAYQKFINQHSADPSQAGFDYQFYCFLNELFNSEQLDEVIYEEEDDVAVISKGITTLIQVKHSVDSNARLTDYDRDLWKSIKNWLNQRIEYESYYEGGFFEKYKFKLITNKTISCEFIEKLVKYKLHDETPDSMHEYIKELSSSSEEVKAGIEALKSLTKEQLKGFLNNLSVECIPDMLKILFESIVRIYHSDEIAYNVLDKVLGKLHREKYNDALKRWKLRYVRKDFDYEFKNILLLDEPDLPKFITEFDPTPELPTGYRDMNMFKQLHLIKVVDLDNELDANIPKYYAMFFHYVRNIRRFVDISIINNDGIDKLEDKAFQIWDRIFYSRELKIRICSETFKESYLIEMGIDCFNEAMLRHLDSFDLNFSNGCFFKLSDGDTPRIGWRSDWREKV